MRLIFLLFLHFIVIEIFAQGFTNVADSNGMAYSYGNALYGGGASFVDFDEDGLDDITFPSGLGGQMHFHKNTGAGFIEQSPFITNTTEKRQPLWVDYDNDGDLDLWLSSISLNRLYRNEGAGAFTDVTLSCGFNNSAITSFNGTWLDYDDDGFLDLVTAHRYSYLVGELTLYHNLGNGNFSNVTASAGLGGGLGNSVLALATLDMNNDGWEDIFVGQDWLAGCIMLKNNGDGTFENISAASHANVQCNSMTTTIGDYNNDGWMDVFITDTGPHGCTLLENQGDETFIDKATAKDVLLHDFTWGASFFDADNDMDLDLHIGGSNNSYMMENINAGAYFLQSDAAWGFENDAAQSIGNAVGDFNGDGFPDLAKNHSVNIPNSLWQNHFTENNFLTVRLIGTQSNRMAVGAVIHLYANGVHQMRRIGCGEGFCSQHSYTQFFGMGDNLVADSLVITWPANGVMKLYNVEANQHLALTELIVEGCTDAGACNYEPAATADNGLCEYAQMHYDCAGNCLTDTDADGICDELEILGCMDALACNYLPDATEEDLCVYAAQYYNCEGECLADSDDDGVCDALEIAGCMDPIACNYMPEATDADACGYAIEFYDCNGNCLADVDMDGVCDALEIVGCQDVAACNYLPGATDAATCNYALAFHNCDGDCISDIDEDGVCDQQEIAGCTDEIACNFLAGATDPGECSYAVAFHDCGGACVHDVDEDGVCDELEILGCTDSNACNYDATATDEDNSCAYLGVTSIEGEAEVSALEYLTYSCLASGSNLYEWTTTSGGSIVSGQGSNEVIIVWNEPGSGMIFVEESTVSGCTGEVIWLELDIANGITVHQSDAFNVYPNPATDQINIRMVNNAGVVSITMCNALGQQVLSETQKGNSFQLNVEQLPNGCYHLFMKHDDVSIHKMIVIE